MRSHGVRHHQVSRLNVYWIVAVAVFIFFLERCVARRDNKPLRCAVHGSLSILHDRTPRTSVTLRLHGIERIADLRMLEICCEQSGVVKSTPADDVVSV